MHKLYSVFALISTAAFAQQAAPPKPAIVDGAVVNSITREPLRKVELTLSTSFMTEDMEKAMAQFGGDSANAASPGAPKTVRKSFAAATDASGKFHFEVEPGDYYLKAKHAGYGDVTYKPQGKYALEGKVHLQAGDELTQVTLRMVPHGAVSGRVIDEDGDPVSSAMVTAQTYMYGNGRKHLVPVDTGQTNDRGEYRLGKLPPGHYYLTASALNVNPLAEAPPPPKDGSPETGYVATYYPKATNIDQAGAIDVAAAADLPGFEIQLQKSRVVRIKGKAVGEDGAPLKTAQIMLMSAGNLGSMQMRMLNDPQGRFEIANIQPGTYIAMTMQMGGSSPTMHMQTLVVPAEGIGDLVLGGQKDGSVKGRVAVSGNGKVALGGLRVQLSGDMDSPVMPAAAGVSESGEFTVNKVAPQPYQVSMAVVPEGAYLKSVRWQDREMLGKPVDFSAGFAGTLEVTLGTDGGQFETTVSRDDKPVSGATVLLIAADPNARFPAATRTAETDAAGHVLMKDIAPGDYLAFAWEDVEEQAWSDPAFLKPLEAQATSVTVHPGGHEKAEVKLIASK